MIRRVRPAGARTGPPPKNSRAPGVEAPEARIDPEGRRVTNRSLPHTRPRVDGDDYGSMMHALKEICRRIPLPPHVDTARGSDDEEDADDRLRLAYGDQVLSPARAAAELDRFGIARPATRERRPLLLAAVSAELARAGICTRERRAYMRHVNRCQCVPPLLDREVDWIDEHHGAVVPWTEVCDA